MGVHEKEKNDETRKKQAQCKREEDKCTTLVKILKGKGKGGGGGRITS